MFQGSIVAIVTPMNPDGTIDKKSLHELVDWHLASQTDGIVVAGTTGESPTLNANELLDLVQTVVNQVNKRIPIIAGSGSNSTQHTIDLTQLVKKAGADAALIVTPYYNKPTQNGLFEHYKTVAEKTDFPIILYNVPGRTSCDLLPETIARLAQIKHIIGIKEATGKIERTEQILSQCQSNFLILSGDDPTAMDLILKGAKGVISVTANVAPHLMHELCKAALSGNTKLAQEINNRLMPLHKNLFLESNPIPTKWALYEMGRIPNGIRLPLLPLDPKYRNELINTLQNAGLK